MNRPFSICIVVGLGSVLAWQYRGDLLQKAIIYKPLIETLSALLAPVIALTVAYIAYEQYRTACVKYKADQYDRRITIYKAVKKFIGRTMALGYPENEDLREYWILIGEADFLFNKDVREYVETLFRKGTELRENELFLQKENNDSEREALVKAHRLMFEWFQAQYDVAYKKFEPYLKL